MPLTADQLARRKRINRVVLRVLCVPFLFLALVGLLGGQLLFGLLFLLVGLFMALAWLPPRPTG